MLVLAFFWLFFGYLLQPCIEEIWQNKLDVLESFGNFGDLKNIYR
jgi:hypothetical protein